MTPQAPPTLAEATPVWARIGIESFGGPAAQIAVMHRVVVDEKGWVAEDRFLHALNLCMLLPGPEAHQLVTFLGWSFHGVRGGLVAGALFVLPGAGLLLAVSLLYVAGRDTALVGALLAGLKPAALVVVWPAMRRIGAKVTDARWKWGVAALALGAAALRVPYPLVVLGAGLAGLQWSGVAAEAGAGPWPSTRATLGRLGLGLGAWLAPVALAAGLLGVDHAIVQVGLVFSVVAVVTFGGAYAVLGFVAREAVERFGWVSGPEMLDGLAFAETMPGPLVLVLQHVGFMAGWNHPGGLAPVGAALLGALLASWVTFVPSFTWVLTFAPYVEALRGDRRARAALDGVGAAVAGVLAHLVAWFAWEVLDGPGPLLILVACALASWLRGGSVGVVLAVGLLGGVVVRVALG